VLNLPRKTFDAIKNRLLRQQKEIEQEIKSIKKDDPLNGDSLAESSEPGTDSWLADMHGRTLAISDNLMLLLGRTKKALMNMRSGKYGKCENCGKPIELARLEAIPTATLCLSCSRKIKTKR
jgi:DnaK suppressor protein